MQSSDLPSKNTIPFANAADSSHKRVIPTPSQTATASDAPASFTDGFPPLTFLNKGAGGIPPNGEDMNGILNFITAWTRWIQAGGVVPYDASFQTSIGGYPKNARVASAANPASIWISTADNNATNPDTGGAGWVSATSTSYSDSGTAGTDTIVVPAWASHAEIQMVGAGGGGGGGSSSYSGGGGGAGGYAFGVVSVTPGATLTRVVGAGGVGGTANGGTGGAGGTTSLTGLGSASGGQGGIAGSASSAGGTGGAGGGTGMRNFQGGIGGDGNSASAAAQGGNGAGGPFGGQGRTGSGTGVAGAASGAGGGGSWGTPGPGGAGAPGVILIRWLP